MDKGKVYTEHNFLPVELVMKIKSLPRDSKISGTNLTDWRQEVVQTSGPILLYTVDESIRDEVSSVITGKLNLPETYNISYMAYTLGGRYSYLPWHDDNVHKFALTVYLNDSWDLNWGGAFMYQDGYEYKAIYPEYNKATYFMAPINHCTSMPSVQAPYRESLQVFLD